MSAARKFLLPLTAALLVTAADQATKFWIVREFRLHESRPVIAGWFDLVHVRNTGVAFSLLSSLDPRWFNPILIVATALAAVAVLAYIYYLPQRGPAPFGLGLILGGAIGNLFDRARLGYVVDFLDVYWRDYHWPAFNVADIGITAGVFLLILDLILSKEEEGAPRPR